MSEYMIGLFKDNVCVALSDDIVIGDNGGVVSINMTEGNFRVAAVIKVKRDPNEVANQIKQWHINNGCCAGDGDCLAIKLPAAMPREDRNVFVPDIVGD